MIRSAFQRDARGDHSFERDSKRGAARIHDGRVIESSGSRRGRGSSETLPRIHGDVVMIAAGGKKSGAIGVVA